MKSTIKVRQHRSEARPSPQAKTPAEFKVVRLRECPMVSPIIENPPQVVGFWREHVITAPWFRDDKENLCVFLLNSRRRLLGFELVGLGSLDTVLMHPREVLRLATVKKAKAIIVAHNHPSGDPSPSEADIKAMRDLIRAASQLEIELLDHVIIGDARREKGYASLRELGYFYVDDPAQTSTRKDSKDVRDAAEEINLAASQSNVLLELIENHLDYREHRGGEDFTGERADQFNFGLSMLVQHASDRLKKSSGGHHGIGLSKKSGGGIVNAAEIIKLSEHVSKLAALGERETDDRLEMCLNICRFVVELKNFQAVQARLLADSGVFVEESSRQEFLRRVAQIERQCELLEHTLAKASKPDGNDPAAAATET